LLCLLFASLAIITLLLEVGTGLIRGANGLVALPWCVLLLVLAVMARTAGWWQREMQAMTAERVQNYFGSLVILFVALSLSGHLISESLGLGPTFPLLGPLAGLPQAALTLALLTLAGLLMLAHAPMDQWARSLVERGRAASNAARNQRSVNSVAVADLPVYRPVVEMIEEISGEPTAERIDSAIHSEVPPPMPPTVAEEADDGPKPPIEIFIPAPKQHIATNDLEHKARRIEETLASFNVGARVVGHHCGPVVTQFDLEPDRGVKVRRITELHNDLALALASPTIRILAPVPGRPVVGIEIPNEEAATVSLRELLESERYRAMSSPLKVILGKDVAGNPAIIDLAKMPHLLIAGATGSGKSVCVNALISCLLYQSTPEDVRLMMVDPKMVELTVYNGVPHLLSPVVTEMDKVVGVLQWAIREMERRYQLLKSIGVRNIGRYNEKMAENGLKRLPYIVLVVDELADLMMVAPDDVEDAICRLAQLARAAGIHLVIATQRPSVDVVTGLIKANFPARIAFAMTSQVDSRTILDTVGAEKLLGRGDMLYMPPDAPKPVRLQGAFLSDREIEDLVEFWQRNPMHGTVPQVSEEEFEETEKVGKDAFDDMYDEAVRAVREYQHASVSLLQRRLKVGYARAARLMDELETSGVVGPADGAKQRRVLPENTEAD